MLLFSKPKTANFQNNTGISHFEVRLRLGGSGCVCLSVLRVLGGTPVFEKHMLSDPPI